jgi:hypothetical protein
VNKAATLFAFCFVGLITIVAWLLPVGLYFIPFGRIGGVIFAGCYAMIWLGIILWVVRGRRRRFGRFWPTKPS